MNQRNPRARRRSQAPSVWSKVDIERYKRERQASRVDTTPSMAADISGGTLLKLPRPVFWWSLSITAALSWIYALLKLFVSDIDRWVVSRVTPSLLWIVDYRFFFLLGFFALALLFVKRWKLSMLLAYVVLFPLIVVLWYIPRLYYRKRDWIFLLGSYQVLWSLSRGFRFSIVATAVLTMAALTNRLSSDPALISMAVIASLLSWFMVLGRAVKSTLQPSQFAVHQQILLRAILGSRWVWSMTEMPAQIRNSSVRKFNKAQMDALLNPVSIGLAPYGGSALWAARLEQYRKSNSSVIFSAVGILVLVVQATVIFALINWGVYRIDPTEFAASGEPHAWTFIRYAFSSMYPGEIAALTPWGSGGAC